MNLWRLALAYPPIDLSEKRNEASSKYGLRRTEPPVNGADSMKFIYSTAISLALVFSADAALAADLPSQKAPPSIFTPLPPTTWTGFYAGLNAGGTWGSNDNAFFTSAPIFQDATFGPAPWAGAAASGATGVLHPDGNAGFIGGAEIGYNCQFANKFVGGAEADIQGIAISGGFGSFFTSVPVPLSGGVPLPTANTVISDKATLRYLGTARGHIGFLVTQTLQIYGTGGFAYGGASSSIAGLQGFSLGTPGFATTGFGAASFSETRVGWAAGAGLEWMFAPHWTAKVEYLYYDLGSAQLSSRFTTTIVNNTAIAWVNQTRTRTQFNGNNARLGINYHFNFWQDPSLASY